MHIILKTSSIPYKNAGIALYMATILLLSVLVFSLNNALTSTIAYGAISGNNNNEVNNRLSINDISGQLAGSN